MPSGRTIAILSQKGGVGKTTTAVNLAYGLAARLRRDRGGNVLLLDLDPQGHCALSLGVATTSCASDWLLARALPEDQIVATRRRAGDEGDRANLFLLPATARLARLPAELAAAAAAAGVRRQWEDEPAGALGFAADLATRLEELQQVFAYVVIDVAAGFTFLHRALYNVADVVVAPVRVDYLSVVGAGDVTQADLLLPTFARVRQLLSQEMLARLREVVSLERLARPIPASVRLAEAPAAGGQTIFEYAPDSAPARAYQHLVERLHAA
jgi:chromosome partitioning protein